MGEYNYDTEIVFDKTTGNTGIKGNFSGTASDNIAGNANIDEEFTTGETIITPGGNSTYVGTIEIKGTTFFVVDRGTSDYIAFAFTGDPTFSDDVTNVDPATLDDMATFPLCFGAGTWIDGPDGAVTVETLSIGDLILAADGRTVPVKWIGHHTMVTLFSKERACPVRVSAGVLGGGLPHSDLVLTADHALILDGLAINAGALVNGTTITYDPVQSLPDRVTYYHVETEDHDIILANGAPAETYVDYVQRQVFDNYQEYVDLYGEERKIREMALPRISAARLVPPAIKARLRIATAA